MALTIQSGKSPSAHEALFGKLLTSEEDKALLVEVVHNTKATFVVGFYNVTASFVYEGKTGELQITLPSTTTAIMKNAVQPSVVAACRDMLVDLLDSIKAKATGQPVASGVKVKTGMPKIGQIESVGEPEFDDGESLVPKKSPKFMTDPPLNVKVDKFGVKKPAPTGKTMKLANAQAVGQHVFGTSSGSVYTTVAVNERVKIAMRLSNGSISIRAEGKPNPKEKEALASLGMTGHSGDSQYWSMHMKMGDVPPARTVGALIMGLGLDFDDQLTSMKDLINEN